MNQDLKKIKDKYGEKMMHLCRTLFPTILETEGVLFKLLEDNFYYSKSLYEDIVNNSLEYKFKDYMYSLLDIEEQEEDVIKTPHELLSDAGYELYECQNENDIQKFRKYYALGEELCTFRGNRLDSCYVFFAVKKNVDEIIRSNFKYPERQDEYGTSVISIQFSRGKHNTLSIKNRYNHRVNNPDATFSNNLDNISVGLTDSFQKFYKINITRGNTKSFEIPNYVQANDGKFYKYNYEIDNKYYCNNNIIIDNFRVIDIYMEKEKYIVMDYFILDLVNKKVFLYDELNINEDEFFNTLNGFNKVEIKNIKKNKSKEIRFIFDKNDVIVKLDKDNKIIFYKNDKLTSIGNSFLNMNKYLKEIIIPNTYSIGDYFLEDNLEMINISLPSVIKIGSFFMRSNKLLKNFDANNLNIIGYWFLPYTQGLRTFSANKLNIVGDHFLAYNKYLTRLSLPNLIKAGNRFLYNNEYLYEIKIPKLEEVGNEFLKENNALKVFSAPKLKIVGDQFLYLNNTINDFYAPLLKKIGDNCLYKNTTIENIILPSIDKKSKYFGLNNQNFKKILNLRKK